MAHWHGEHGLLKVREGPGPRDEVSVACRLANKKAPRPN
jgi:hypothetical protein